ncbi:MAG: FAD assembly factor SdhE [Gammaproteobacteria bacterium]
MSELDRLRWQCRRGALELDLLLERYLDTAYEQADDDEKARFADLLYWEDDALLNVLVGGKMTGKPGFDSLIDKLRGILAADKA